MSRSASGLQSLGYLRVGQRIKFSLACGTVVTIAALFLEGFLLHFDWQEKVVDFNKYIAWVKMKVAQDCKQASDEMNEKIHSECQAEKNKPDFDSTLCSISVREKYRSDLNSMCDGDFFIKPPRTIPVTFIHSSFVVFLLKASKNY